VLDIGSSTGGFTQYALMHGAKQVVAVDVGTNQLHPSLRDDPRIMLFEQTDFRDLTELPATPEVVLADVSFISLREILPTAHKLGTKKTQYVIMVKPQFEAGDQLKHKGVIKNDTMRRQILKDFENWVQKLFIIRGKADSEVSGSHGNRERFYLLTKVG
jgi:23S rRNA (cytidine1920-2'-O)/16S rRNA (cytidine1409-2'-O)-methyltransferase